jgi:hypothetical protein
MNSIGQIKFIAIRAQFGVSLFVRRDQILFVGVDNKHSQKARGLTVTGICTDEMMIASYFGPALAGVIHLFRTVIDFATNRTLQHRCIDESRGWMGMRGIRAPLGWYSTSTPFILLPGTFGRARSKTNVTLALSVFIRTVGKSLAEAPLTKRAARATPQRNLVNIVFASLRQMRRYKSTVKSFRVFQSKIARGVNRGFAIISCYPMGRSC